LADEVERRRQNFCSSSADGAAAILDGPAIAKHVQDAVFTILSSIIPLVAMTAA